MPDSSLSMSLDDPELMRSLGMPASPVTGAGQDPDEMWAMMPRGGPVGQPEMVRQAPSSAQAAGTTGGAGAAQPAPTQGGGPGNATDANDPAAVARTALTAQLNAGNKLIETGDQMQDDPAFKAVQQSEKEDLAGMPNAADPKYRPSFGQRVLRGLRGAGLGLAEHGIFGMAAGAIDPALVPGGKAYGAPNDAYDTAQAQQEKKFAADQQSAADLLANFKRSQELLKNRQSAYDQGGQIFDKAATAGTSLAKLPNETTTANAEMVKAKAEAAKVALETPEAKDAATRTLIAQRTNQANMDPVLKQPGYLRSRFILTGEFQPQRDLNAAEVEQEEVTNLTAAWRQAHPGQKPGFEDLQKIYQSVRGGGGAAGERGADANARTAARLAAKRVEDLTNLQAKYGLLWSAEEKKQHDADLAEAQQEAQTLQAALAQPAGAAGPPPAAAPAVSPAPAAPQPQRQPPRPPANPADRVRIKRPDGTFGRIPKANLAAALANGAVEAPAQ